MTYDPDYPIVLGLSGDYASGKTATANGLAPAARISFRREGEEADDLAIRWDHLYFALPIYQMATARQSIEGQLAQDRIRYEIHATLLEIFGESPLYGAPTYSELVAMVEEVATTPCVRDGKPRKFLRHVGTDICRAYDEDAFVNWMKRKVAQLHREFKTDEDVTENDVLGIVISDVRHYNEAQFIKEHPNGVLLRLDVDSEVAKERQHERDGFVHPAHPYELSDIPEEWFVETIDTTELTIEQQVQRVKSVVANYTGVSSA